MTFITVTEPLGVRKHLVTFNTNCNSKVKRSFFYINVYYKKCLQEVQCITIVSFYYMGSLWSWLYGSLIYNYLCNQCLSVLTLWVWIPFKWGVLNTTLCDQVCHGLAKGRWFSLGTPVSSTNKTDRHDIFEILL